MYEGQICITLSLFVKTNIFGVHTGREMMSVVSFLGELSLYIKAVFLKQWLAVNRLQSG